MDIKSIDNSINRDPSSKPASGNDRAATAGTSSQGAPQTNDTLTLTDAVAQLIELQDNLAKVPDVRNERVEAIRQALADGLYEVDAEKLAENLVKSEQE